VSFEFNRPLIFVAHPDDETLGCGGLLQRMSASLIVFATNGAPPYYGFERKFKSLENYSHLRFEEAARVVAHLPNSSFQRLTQPDASHFVDQHLFHHLRPALNSLCQIARAFSPDALLTHAYEGGHIDHDACSFIANRAAATLSIPVFEFPLYSNDANGKPLLQQFRGAGPTPKEYLLTETETASKKKMLAEYKTQPGLTPIFQCTTERLRPATGIDYSIPQCRAYSYRGQWTRLWPTRIHSQSLLKKFREFKA